ncbi:MAG: imidazole glycerol phosphate synthase subunit HisF [Clostridia bacterium]
MLAKRIIPCLDVADGRVVKGINFVNLKDVGDPTEIAKMYEQQGADELVFLDITATNEKRDTICDTIKKVASCVFMPLTVGGGIRSLEDFTKILRSGADKISVNSIAVKDKSIISRAADKFGSQCVVLAIDAKKTPLGNYNVFINGGRIDTGIDAVEWAVNGAKFGAGEILLTSMDADGTKDGFDLEITKKICDAVNIPVIASGGCGKLSDFAEVFKKTNCDAALAASLFHYGELTIDEVKEYLKSQNINVR